MATPLDIDQMTIEEKLQTMEALWNDLCRNEETVPVYDWHKDILEERESLIEQGSAEFLSWEQAKDDITRQTS
jgi:Putative addiction module component